MFQMLYYVNDILEKHKMLAIKKIHDTQIFTCDMAVLIDRLGNLIPLLDSQVNTPGRKI